MTSQPGTPWTDLTQQVEPVDIRHPQVDHREIGGLAQQRSHRLGAACAGHHVEADTCGEPFDDLQHRDLVVDDEEQRAVGFLGRHHGDGSAEVPRTVPVAASVCGSRLWLTPHRVCAY